MHHGRRLQRALPVCDDSCATANNGICEARDAAVGTEDCERPTSSRAQSSCAANTDSTDCGQCQPCRAPAGAPPPPPPPSPPSPPEGGEGGGGGLEPRGGPTRGSDFENDWRPPCRLADAVAIDLGFAPCAETVESWVRAYVVRADHHVAEKLAMGNLTAAEALLPTTPRDRGVGIIDESEGPIRVKDDIQTQFLSFPMEGNMAGIDEIEERVYLFVVTNSQDPIGMAVKVNDLGWTGPAEEFLAFCILVCVFAMIVFEVVHHTLAAMIGSYVVLLVLAMQHRMPDIAEVVSFMDHGTLALLWGMMIIVGVTAKTGVFEWMAVRLYVVSGGEPFKLLFWLCILDIVLSAFLDNVTTMLLLAPVSIQLCDAVGRDPRPFLISLALFGNVGGTMTMIGDPPNIIIGNMMKEFVTFNDFIVYLGPGVIISLPTSFWFTKWYFRAVLGDKMEVNLEQLEKDNSIRDHRLLIKTGIMLVAVIAGFFLHPVIHMDPVYVAVSGAIVIFALDNHHDLEEALEGVEWDTLIFFAALFVMVEGLAEMGLLRMIGNQLSEVVESFDPASRQANAIIIVSYVSAVTSAFVDNIPFTTTMIPIIKQIAEDVDGIRIEPLIWSLAFGSCLGGMGTLIGASDNVVMAGIAEKVRL